jgi:hypothetical protein
MRSCVLHALKAVSTAFPTVDCLCGSALHKPGKVSIYVSHSQVSGTEATDSRVGDHVSSWAQLIDSSLPDFDFT